MTMNFGQAGSMIRVIPPTDATVEVKAAAKRAGVIPLGSRGELHVFVAPEASSSELSGTRCWRCCRARLSWFCRTAGRGRWSPKMKRR
jgi:hypothetical protein